MNDEEDIFTSRIVRSAKKKNKQIFQRILSTARDDFPPDKCMFQEQSDYKLARNPIVTRIRPQSHEDEEPRPAEDSGLFRIRRYETDEAVGWQIEVDHERAKQLDEVFEGFAEFLTRLARAA